MRKKIILLVYAATLAVVWASSGYHLANACQVDEFYLTKESTLAATSPEALNSAVSLARTDQAKLNDLIKAGTIIQVKEGTKVQVKERSFERKMLQINLPAGTTSYWIKDGVLKEIDCK